MFIAGKDFLRPVGREARFSGVRPHEVRMLKPTSCSYLATLGTLVRFVYNGLL